MQTHYLPISLKFSYCVKTQTSLHCILNRSWVIIHPQPIRVWWLENVLATSQDIRHLSFHNFQPSLKLIMACAYQVIWLDINHIPTTIDKLSIPLPPQLEVLSFITSSASLFAPPMPTTIWVIIMKMVLLMAS